MIKKLMVIPILAMLLMLVLVSGQSFIFKQNDKVNYRFRCLDESNNFCSTGTIVTLSLEDPFGNNVYDNSTMTANPTYYNHSLSTEKQGEYKAIIVAPGNTNTTTEFTYLVNSTGLQDNNFPIQLGVLGLGFILAFTSYVKSELRILRFVGGILVMIIGVLTIYPGYAGIDHTSLIGQTIGYTSIGAGLWFMVQDLFGVSNSGKEDWYEEEY